MEKAFQKLFDSWETSTPSPGNDCYTAEEDVLNQLRDLSAKSHRCGRVPAYANMIIEQMELLRAIKRKRALVRQALNTQEAFHRTLQSYIALDEATQGQQDRMLREMANVERLECGTTGCVSTSLDDHDQEENGANTSPQ
ncbi:hypothetical protein GCK32_018637 [Trichostrongylus colubriformis]|uniref:Uncharacterized protein n=1 Tax=Trichostrongylus colubriformis TaxID=6319 RepID=A0AAN8IFW6_TRICO